nr:NB-ARC domain-containing protein [Pseudonocardia acidicola]
MLTGRPGAGKTALAVEAGHRLGELFPDGALGVELRDGRSVYEVTGRLLRSLGVPSADLPDRPGPRLAAYHRALAERRVLVLLDDVAATAQVAPLLPVGGGSFALLTSRHTLPMLPPGLVRLRIGDLDAADARRLLEVAVGDDLDGPAELIRLCAGLPLALRIVAARLAGESDLSPARLAHLLGRRRGMLGELRAGEQTVEAAFALSYEALAPAQRSVFRRLAAAPLRDLTPGAAAALAGRPEELVGPLLRGLHGAHLLDLRPPADSDAGPARYELHALLRRYAEQRLSDSEPPGTTQAAQDRLTRHYLALLDRCPERAWFTAERDNLPVVADLLARSDPAGSDRLAAALARRCSPRAPRARWR